jgi:sugar phosphate isomerase/epimerase
MHPHTVAYNPSTLLRLLDGADIAALGANLDPSHLFWQGIDPCRAVALLGKRVFHAAAKDTYLDPDGIEIHGVLDDRYRRPRADEDAYELGAGYVVTVPAKDPAWRFVTVGRGHDVSFWADFLAALASLADVDAIAIEHGDLDVPVEDGVAEAARCLSESRNRISMTRTG